MCPSFDILSALSIGLLSSYEAFQNPSRLRLNSEFIWKIAFRFGLLVCNGCKESDTFGMPRGADTIIMSPGDVRTQISKLTWFSFRLVVVYAQSIKAKCSIKNYVWVINNFIACLGGTYIRCLTVVPFLYQILYYACIN